jgi:hypothetical protein
MSPWSLATTKSTQPKEADDFMKSKSSETTNGKRMLPTSDCNSLRGKVLDQGHNRTTINVLGETVQEPTRLREDQHEKETVRLHS